MRVANLCLKSVVFWLYTWVACLFGVPTPAQGQNFRTLYSFLDLPYYLSDAATLGSDGNFYGVCGDGGSNARGIIVKLTPDGIVSLVYGFDGFSQLGLLPGKPTGRLVEVGKGVFYGVTQEGGAHRAGVVFKVTQDGVFTVLHDFSGLSGSSPSGGLVMAKDGNLYGVTPKGGANDKGCIYRITTSGLQSVIYNFPKNGASSPAAQLTLGADGALYGSTNNGSSLFKVTTAGVLTTLHVLTNLEGANLATPLVLASDGNFYGVAFSGGANNTGTAFRMTAAGSFTVLLDFQGRIGENPLSLMQASDGNLYGAARFGGRYGQGTLFRLTTAGNLNRTYDFGTTPRSGGLVEKNGVIYGADSGRMFTITPTTFYKEVVYFNSLATGINPTSRLIQASDGNFYGSVETTGGLIYRMTPSGDYTVLHRFTELEDGGYPSGNLIQGRDGNFYGVDTHGGANGVGIIFKLTPNGQLTVLYNFLSNGSVTPSGGLVEGSDGKFYGVLSEYGPQGVGSTNGSIYTITPAGAFSIIHNFPKAEGGYPTGPLLLASDGNFYGTCEQGPVSTDQGMIFRMSPTGVVKVLARLSSSAYRIQDGLLQGMDGDLYGIAYYGNGVNSGALIRCTRDGVLTVITVFDPTIVSRPNAGAVFGPDGNLYGTTGIGPGNKPGTVYKLTTSGVMTILKTFEGMDGYTPMAPLTVGRDGDLYGSTNRGGPGGGGTLFALDIFPTVKTLLPSEITPYSTKLKAMVNPNHEATTVEFFVDNVSRGTVLVPAGTTSVTAELVVHGLTGHIDHVSRAEATNRFAGPVTGGDVTFGTPNTPPTAGDITWHAVKDLTTGAPPVLDVLAKISDTDNDPLVISSVTQASHLHITFAGTTLSYDQVDSAYNGNDTFTYTVRDPSGETATGTVTLVNSAPVAANNTFLIAPGAASLNLLAGATDPDGDPLMIAAVSQGAHGAVTTDGKTATYQPGPDFRGEDSFTYTISDPTGVTSLGHVILRANYAVERALASSGEEIPGVDGATWKTFGFPSLFVGGDQAGWRATYRIGAGLREGIFSGGIGQPQLRLSQGAHAPDRNGAATQALFGHFEHPVFAGDDFAVVGKLEGPGVTPQNLAGVWVSSAGAVHEIAHANAVAAGTVGKGTPGARFRSFSSVAMPSPGVVFIKGKLQQKGQFLTDEGYWVYEQGVLFYRARPRPLADRVDETNDDGLWLWSEGEGLRLILREGQTFHSAAGPTYLKSFRVLDPVNGSGGHARYDSEVVRLDALLLFADGSRMISAIGASGVIVPVAATGELDTAGRKALSFGMPSSPGDGEPPVAMATLRKVGLHTPSYAAIFDFGAQKSVAEENLPAPGADGALFKSFADPVAGLGLDGGKVVAFAANLSGVAAKSAGLWSATYERQTPSLSLVARKGDEAPGMPGRTFASFESLSVLQGRGPVFVARVSSSLSQRSAKPSRGCWARCSDGSLQLILAEGSTVNGKTLRTFSLLNLVPGSYGQRRSWAEDDSTPSLIYRATWTDGSEGIVTVSIP